jgi:hypothetical protein
MACACCLTVLLTQSCLSAKGRSSLDYYAIFSPPPKAVNFIFYGLHRFSDLLPPPNNDNSSRLDVVSVTVKKNSTGFLPMEFCRSEIQFRHGVNCNRKKSWFQSLTFQ